MLENNESEEEKIEEELREETVEEKEGMEEETEEVEEGKEEKEAEKEGVEEETEEVGEGKEETEAGKEEGEESEEEKTPPESKKTSVFGLEENFAGALAYLGTFVTGILLLIMEKENRFVRFHAMQSVVIFLPAIIVIYVLDWVFYYTCFMWIVIWVLDILLFIVWIVGMWKAYQGDYFKFPVVGDIAENLLKSVKI